MAGVYTGPKAGPITGIAYAFDQKALYLLLESSEPWASVGDFVGIYLNVPRYPATVLFSRYGKPTTVLGFAATHEVAVDLRKGTAILNRAQDGTWLASPLPVTLGLGGQVMELAIPYEGLTRRDEETSLGPLESGDTILARVVLAKNQKDVAQVPTQGPARFTVPDLGTMQVILTVKDPKGDDHGPGTYTYPTDPVFKAGIYDILEFTVAQEETTYVFRVKFNGPVENVWGSPNGLSPHTIDIYLDTDHTAGSGSRRLLDARNAAVSAEDAWDWVLWAEGWAPGVFKVGKDGKPEKADVPMKIVTDPAGGTVTIRVPKNALPGDPTTWGYLAVVLSQDGFGTNRVRDVQPKAEQWRVGGGPDDTNHTRIMDVAWDGTPSQEEMLSAYRPSKEVNLDKVDTDDFAQLRMVRLVR